MNKTVEKIMNYSFIIVVSTLFIIPFLYIVSISLSQEIDIIKYGYKLVPPNISFYAYEQAFAAPEIILRAYGVSIFVTVVGTMLTLSMSTGIAYVVSRKDYAYRKLTSVFLFIPLLFNGGLVSQYIVITKVFHLSNNLMALILPYAVNVWYVFMLRGFMSGLSNELIESAKIDGANEFKIFFRIIIPLSKPGIATVALFYTFAFWNDWWLAMLYITDDKLMPLQYLLQRLMMNIEFILSQLPPNLASKNRMPIEGFRMALALIAAGPMLVVFPFFQKYFVKGISLGSVKG